eukprot:CAMPEP_0197547068 /NCGR_PEP_ID=MMETSP1320-20131121/1506_1 /TAXON_ID=91990 /ORGANISM="Bolidomonas sp., Strain RCC2347" /LENGTH=116 /DNA_ID=CAMNT_0043106765 /DNA_START=16 /DNA_END=366 /DNA_ORIENTATION=-
MNSTLRTFLLLLCLLNVQSFVVISPSSRRAASFALRYREAPREVGRREVGLLPRFIHGIDDVNALEEPDPLSSLEVHSGRFAMIFFVSSMLGERFTGFTVVEQVSGCVKALVTGGG